jgi:hypothetical protein
MTVHKVNLILWTIRVTVRDGIAEENSDEGNNGTNVAGTLSLKRKNVPPTVKD